MDDVIADQIKGRLERHNVIFQSNLEREDLKGISFYEHLPEAERYRSRAILDEPGFFMNLEVLEGAQEVIADLSQHYEIFIATAAMEVPTSFSEKYIWLRKHFPFLDPMNYIFCGHKYMLQTDYLIDDNPKHFDVFPGTGLLFDSPFNQHVNHHRRVKSWWEIRGILL